MKLWIKENKKDKFFILPTNQRIYVIENLNLRFKYFE